MSTTSLAKDLIEAGIHFGHKSAGWDPRMRPYIYAKRGGIHIIDVRETLRGLMLAKKFITNLVAEGKDVLFVGTKRQAAATIRDACQEVDMPYVTERWLGGTLTNFRTIRSRLDRLEDLETLISSSEWENYSKKMSAQLARERRKIDRNLGGIRGMNKLPGALFAVDVRREHNALKEAKRLGIPTICLVDTDSNPELVDLPIPGNDDAMRAIELIIREVTSAVAQGKTAQTQQEQQEQQPDQEHATAEETAHRFARARPTDAAPATPEPPPAPVQNTSEGADEGKQSTEGKGPAMEDAQQRAEHAAAQQSPATPTESQQS